MVKSWVPSILDIDDSAEFQPGATNDQLVSLEKAFNIRIPDEFRSLLTETDGVMAQYGSDIIWDCASIESQNVEFRQNWAFVNSICRSTIFCSLATMEAGINSPLRFTRTEQSISRTFSVGNMKPMRERGTQAA